MGTNKPTIAVAAASNMPAYTHGVRTVLSRLVLLVEVVSFLGESGLAVAYF
jgi:hypothetical protein